MYWKYALNVCTKSINDIAVDIGSRRFLNSAQAYGIQKVDLSFKQKYSSWSMIITLTTTVSHFLAFVYYGLIVNNQPKTYSWLLGHRIVRVSMNILTNATSHDH